MNERHNDYNPFKAIEQQEEQKAPKQIAQGVESSMSVLRDIGAIVDLYVKQGSEVLLGIIDDFSPSDQSPQP